MSIRLEGSRDRFVKQDGKKQGQVFQTSWHVVSTGFSNSLSGSKDRFVKQVSRE